MLVSDLKNEIKKYDKKELESIIVELYKRIPKGKKEDYNIDEFIMNLKENKKTAKKEISFEDLKKEILYFLECVDNEYYCVPNRVVSKKERSSWRFKVKRYYKELNGIKISNPNGNIATVLLIEIFKRLSIGSCRLLFVNWETFRALGVSQSDYYDTIIKRILYNGYSKENLEKCIDLLGVDKDPYELSDSMYYIFVSNLKTNENKELAIELLDEKIEELEPKMKSAKNYHTEFYIKEDINDLTKCIMEIYCNMHKVDEGIKYFHKKYIESHKEVKEYILLDKLADLDLIKEWIVEYENKQDKINFRDSLKERYKEFKKLIS